MQPEKPKFVEFKIINNREEAPAPIETDTVWPGKDGRGHKSFTMEDMAPLIAASYQDMLVNMLRNDSIMYARMKDYKRDRGYGRSKWHFRVHSKAGRLLEKLGYWHLIDYIAFMWGIARQAWSFEDYEYWRLSDD